MAARYLELFRRGELSRRAHMLRCHMEFCTLCPRRCRVDRFDGNQGFCRLSDSMMISHALPHFGEEPPISGTCGTGTIFFTSCNLRCIYCQNYQISHDMAGRQIDVDDLSNIMIDLQERNCHNIEAVTPTPHVFRFAESLQNACEKGLHLPLVYNCGGYENSDILAILDGVVDIYLPDFKYGDGNVSLRYSGVRDYHHHAVQSLREMIRQVGDVLETDGDVARRGIIIRHLILPGEIHNSISVLELIKEHVSLSVPISLMAQYSPVPPVARHPLLGRTITETEYETVVDRAVNMGFDHIFVQEVNDEHQLLPDFEKDQPFLWDDRRRNGR